MADIDINAAVKKENRNLMVALSIVIVALIVFAIIGFCFLNRPDNIIEGQADATSVKISGKLPGRVVELFVKEGDMVKKGDTLVHIHSSLAEAKLYQAQSIEDAAAAQNKKVDRGTRSQIIQSAANLLAQAKAAQEIAEKTYRRMENLYNEKVISEQKRDEAKAAYDAANAAVGVAQSQYDLALSGAQSEDKQSAAAMADAAKGSVMEVESLLEDQYLTAPYDGQIDQIYPNVSELVSLGSPIMSLLLLDDKWITFNVREEYLNDLKLGNTIEVMIPALDKKKIKARIYYSRDMGSYATWRATKSTGQWDSRTFEIKARPIDAEPDLRPGMTAVYFTD